MSVATFQPRVNRAVSALQKRILTSSMPMPHGRKAKIHYDKISTVDENGWPSEFNKELEEDQIGAATDEQKEEIRAFFMDRFGIDAKKCYKLSSLTTMIMRYGFLKGTFYPVRKGGRGFRKAGYTHSFDGDLRFRTLSLGCYMQALQAVYVRGLVKGQIGYYDVVSAYAAVSLLQALPNSETTYVEATDTNWRDLVGIVDVEFEYLPTAKYKFMFVPVPGESQGGRGEWCTPFRGRGLFSAELVKAEEESGFLRVVKLHGGRGFVPTPAEQDHILKGFHAEMLRLKEKELPKGVVRNAVKGVIVRSIGVMGGSESGKPGKLYAPEVCALLYGRAIILLSEIFRAGESLGGYTDSMLAFVSSHDRIMATHAVKELERVGSGLTRDHVGDSLLYLKRGLYSLFKNGKSIKHTNQVAKFGRNFGEVSEEFLKTGTLGDYTKECGWSGNKRLLNPRVNVLAGRTLTEDYQTADAYYSAICQNKGLHGSSKDQIMRALRSEGATYDQVAEDYKLSGITLKRAAKKLGLVEERAKEREAVNGRAADLLRAGRSVPEVMEATGLSRRKIYNLKKTL